MATRELHPSRIPARFFLDYGADDHVSEEGLAVDERGMRFISRWQFTIGTQLDIRCSCQHPRLGREQVHLSGIVVWSEHVPRSGRDGLAQYDTTVLFLELSDELRNSVREFSFHLAATV
jgi:hypothetical protein